MFEARYTISYRVRRGHADLSEAGLQLGDLEDAVGVLVDLLEELRQLLRYTYNANVVQETIIALIIQYYKCQAQKLRLCLCGGYKGARICRIPCYAVAGNFCHVLCYA